jgi:Ca2+-binding EF-hand superfamily protein
MKTFIISTATVALLATSVAAGTPGSGFITNWDLDESGGVSLAEISEKRTDVFATFDENGDGVISAAEYVAFDEARAADQENENEGNGDRGNGGHGKASVGMTLEFNDVDGNGEVSLEEFTAQSAAWFEILDRNGDGEVTSADFGRQ